MNINRMVVMKILFTILFILMSLPLYGQYGIISDDPLPPPDYNTLAPPELPGESYTDPVFNTPVTRMTKCDTLVGDYLGGYFANSEMCYWNIDGSYFLAQENDTTESWNGDHLISTFLFDGQTGERLNYLGRGEIRNWWIRWTITGEYSDNGQSLSFDPKYHFYAYSGNQVLLYDVRDMNSPVILHTFDEYAEIDNAGGEGDVSDDGRYWVLSGDDEDLFVYDLIHDVKYPVSPFDIGVLGCQGGVGVDYATISPKGDYIIVSWGTEPALDQQYHGIEIYDKNWNYIHQIYPGIVHWEAGIDHLGHQVIYTAAGYDFQEIYVPYDISPSDLISINIETGAMRKLEDIPKWAHLVFSANNSIGSQEYMYVSYQDRVESTGQWYPFWGEIIQVPTDGSGATRRLVHHRARDNGDRISKYYTPDINVNRQGSKIVYRSNYINLIGDLYWFDIGYRDDHLYDEVLIHANGLYTLQPQAGTNTGHQLDFQIVNHQGNGILGVDEIQRPPADPLNSNFMNYTWRIKAHTPLESFQTRLTLHYTEDDISGLTESNLAFFRYQNNQWQYISSGINSAENKLSADIDQPGLYTVFEASLPQLNLRLFLEGLTVQADQMHSVWAANNDLPIVSPYADQRLAAFVSTDIVDWISISLRVLPDSPSIWQRSFLLKSNGDVVDPIQETSPVRLPGLTPGEYYIIARHNSHIEFMSAEAVSIANSPVAIVDFSQEGTAAFGVNSMKQLYGQTWTGIGGDFNQDGLVNSLDFVEYYNAKYSADASYNRHDISGDGIINSDDRNIWLQNSRQDRQSNIPAE